MSGVARWLNARVGFTALATTMLGAALAANLSLIVLDIMRDRSGATRAAP